MPDEPALRDPSKLGRCIPVALGAAWIAGTSIAGVIYARAPASFDATGWGDMVSWAVIIGCVGIMAMPMLAAMVIAQWGKAARLLTEFRRGEALAQWTVSPQQWEAFLAGRAARIRAKPWTVVLVCFAVLLLILGYVLIRTESAQTRLSSLVVVAVTAAVGAVCLRRPQRDLLRRNPHPVERERDNASKRPNRRRPVYVGGGDRIGKDLLSRQHGSYRPGTARSGRDRRRWGRLD